MADAPFIAAIAASVSAAAACTTAIVAIVAVTSWRRTLRNQRTDECVGATHELPGALGRCLSNWQYGNREEMWINYTQAWNAWRELNKSHVVLRRYRKGLDQKMPEQMHALLTRVRAICKEQPTKTGEMDKADAIRSEAEQILSAERVKLL